MYKEYGNIKAVVFSGNCEDVLQLQISVWENLSRILKAECQVASAACIWVLHWVAFGYFFHINQIQFI